MAHDHAYLICESKCLVEGYSKEQIDAQKAQTDERIENRIPIELAEYIQVPRFELAIVTTGRTPVPGPSGSLYEGSGTKTILSGVSNKHITDLSIGANPLIIQSSVNYDESIGVISFSVASAEPSTLIAVQINYKINGAQYIEILHG